METYQAKYEALIAKIEARLADSENRLGEMRRDPVGNYSHEDYEAVKHAISESRTFLDMPATAGE